MEVFFYLVVGGVFAIVALVSVIGAFLGEIASSWWTLWGRGGTREMARVERQMALADLVALALVADGRVTDEERSALKSALRELHPDLDAKDVLARVTSLGDTEWSNDGLLRERVSLLGKQLDDAGRRQALAIVAALARGGSALRGAPGYRGEGGTFSEALVDLFAAALGVFPSDAKPVAKADAQ